MGDKMEEANSRAAAEIISRQNLYLKTKEVNKIDLHGLLVAEAVVETKKFVISKIGGGYIIIIIIVQYCIMMINSSIICR